MDEVVDYGPYIIFEQLRVSEELDNKIIILITYFIIFYSIKILI